MVAVEGRGEEAPAGIPNFAWVDQRRLARGRQPPLTHAAYRELQEFGFSAILSLRAEREYPDGGWRAYDVVDERALCDALGLTLHHVACTDFQAPHPGELVKALSLIHDESERGNAVYVHCLAGVGRTGVVSGAWQMLHGVSGTEAMREYAYFCDKSHGRITVQRTREEYLHLIRARHQVWALAQIAAALGLPAELPADFVQAERPANGKGWRRRFRDQLHRHLGHAYRHQLSAVSRQHSLFRAQD